MAKTPVVLPRVLSVSALAFSMVAMMATSPAADEPAARDGAALSAMIVDPVMAPGDADALIASTQVVSVVEPFETVERADGSMYRGDRRVVSAGSDGASIAVSVMSSYDGDAEVLASIEVVLRDSVDEVIAVGTKERPVIPQHTDAAANRSLGAELAAARGWTGDQWRCLDQLFSRESGWRHNALNSSSGAYGIPQALPGDKMAAIGSDWLTNPATQIKWGLAYIAGRYGSPCAAWQHSEERNWY